MQSYDPTVIATFADRLYKEAERIIFSYAVLGFIVAGVAGAGVGFALGRSADDGPTFVAIGGAVFGVLGGALGYLLGRERAFQLKLTAQRDLCLVHIEANTRAR